MTDSPIELRRGAPTLCGFTRGEPNVLNTLCPCLLVWVVSGGFSRGEPNVLNTQGRHGFP